MKDPTNVSVLIVGAGPAGLAAAITAKRFHPDADVCVIEKGASVGNHNLSGAVLETAALAKLLDPVDPAWRESKDAQAVLISTVQTDDVMFFCGQNRAIKVLPILKLARSMKLPFGQMIHEGDSICSISKLTVWLSKIAVSVGVEVMSGFAAEDILWDPEADRAAGVRLVDQGLNKAGQRQRNYLAGEIINADTVILAEGCDGLLTERFIEKAGLTRQGNPLYSLGVKELIRVSDEQYRKFTAGRVVHALGWPLWRPVIGPAMFGGGIMYPMGDNHIAVGIIVGLDYKYHDFNPQDALTLFKEHAWVRQFVAGGETTEAGAKMIPEGGLYTVPRCSRNQTIGRGNVMLIGDSSGFVNMLKIKGLHNAIESGIAAGTAAAGSIEKPQEAARVYTRLLEDTNVLKELEGAKNFRQTVARLGPLLGMPLSLLGKWLPKFKIAPDYRTMTNDRYRLRPKVRFDKDTFTAVAATEHREEQPCHLKILDPDTCLRECLPKFGAPCITFCPAGVYECIRDQPKAAHPSNCLHCKTCQRKCPYDIIRWTVPEPAGGPRYKTM